MVVLFLQAPMVNRILIFLPLVNTMYEVLCPPPPPQGIGLEFVGMIECHSYIMLYSRRDFADMIK